MIPRLLVNSIQGVARCAVVVCCAALRQSATLIPMLLAGWSILSAVACIASDSVATKPRKDGAVNVFHCTFDQQWDENYDTWPDRWVRKTGPNFPHYVAMEIRDNADPTAGRSLAINLDGASASISSPPVSVMHRFMYKLEARIRAVDLQNSVAKLVFEFRDSEDNLIQSHFSEEIQTLDDWVTVTINPVALNSEEIDRAVVRLDVDSGEMGDLMGQVWLDEISISRLPRMNVTTNSFSNVYDSKDDVVVTCSLSGIRERDPEIRFQLLDAMSNPLNGEAGDSFLLDGRLIVEDSKKASDIIDGSSEQPAGYEGSTDWKPPIPGYGSYRVLVRMLSSDPASGTTDDEREMYRREIWLAVLPPLDAPAQGEFGWTLPDGDNSFSFELLTQLLPKVHINWLKIPVWYDANDVDRGDQIIQFTELMTASNIELVGMIDGPPQTVELDERVRNAPSLADLTALDPSLWQPLIDPVMTRLALRIRWWQLGSDRDTSFSLQSNKEIRKQVSELKSRLFRFGQDVRLGLGWNWESENPTTGEVPWDFEVVSAESQPSPEELADLLAEPSARKTRRWVLIEPIARSETAALDVTEAVEVRVRDLVGQIVAAKQHGATTILVPNPFDDERGLMRSSGTPSELLLPWRTAATMLSSARYMGQIQMPGGSENRIFRRDDGEVIMILWNDQPTQEIIYLGENIRHIDCWGRTSTPRTEGHRQVVFAGPFPTYIVGLHGGIAQWRMATQFDYEEVPSVFEVAQVNKLSLKNFFGQGVGGTIQIHVPNTERLGNKGAGVEIPLAVERSSHWNINPDQGPLTLSADEAMDVPIEITLNGATYGEQPIRIDFEIDGEETEPYKFSVYRKFVVGLGEIEIRVTSHFDNNDMLTIEQTMINRGNDLINFNCFLYAAGHRQQRSQVYRLGADDDRKIYRFPKGSDLIGTELLLEIVEVDGPRVLKYPFVVRNLSDPTDQVGLKSNSL